MIDDVFHERLVEAQTACFNAHTDLISELVKEYENHDEIIVELIEERRAVYDVFAKRIIDAKPMPK